MDERQKLHLRRLKECADQIDDLKEGTAEDPGFDRWRGKVKRALKVLFGEESDYSDAFWHLNFRVPGLVLGDPSANQWTRRDEENYQEDLTRAQSIIEEAIEEAVMARPTPNSPRQQREPDPKLQMPPIVVQQIQSVSQMQEVSLSQVIGSIDDLGIEEEEREETKRLAEEFRREAEGKRRWDSLGSILEKMRGLGETVWKQVAVPLIVEMARREAGLT